MDDMPEGGRTPGDGAPRSMLNFLDRFIRSAPTPSLDVVRRSLWTNSPEWSKSDSGRREAVLEQYKLYAEMADRISARRGHVNTFFLTLNTSIISALGLLWDNSLAINQGLFSVPWLVLVAQCVGWFWMLRSYRQLNAAKFVVLGALEEELPASPYWRAEWAALGEGKDPARYMPMSHLEQWIPLFFMLAYTAVFLILLFE